MSEFFNISYYNSKMKSVLTFTVEVWLREGDYDGDGILMMLDYRDAMKLAEDTFKQNIQRNRGDWVMSGFSKKK